MSKVSLILTLLTLSFPLSAFAQSNVPTITDIDSTVADRNTRLVIHGSNFTSYNTVKISKDSNILEGTASSSTGTTAVANLRTPAGGTYQLTLTTSRGEVSNTVPVTINAPVATPSPTTAPASFPQINPFVFGLPTPDPSRSLRFQPEPPFTSPSRGRFQPEPPGCSIACPLSTSSNCVPCRPPSFNPNPIPIPTPNLTCPIDFLFCRRPTHVYTALGDSLGTGLIAAGGYVHNFERDLERQLNTEIDLQNRSQIGATSEMLKVAVQSDSRVRQSIQQADFITFNVGGNDLRAARDQYRRRQCGGADNQDCLRQALSRFQNNWTAITDEILSLRKNDAIAIRSMDIYYPFINEDKATDSWPDDAGSDFVVFLPYIQQVNGHIATTLSSRNVPFARVSTAFNGEASDIDPADRGLIGFDNYHPNTRGHRIIADQLLSAAPINVAASISPVTPVPSSPRPTVSPFDFQSGHSRFSRGPCQTDSQCVTGGCSGEICTSDPESAVSTCEFSPNFPNARGLQCGCLPTNVCGWR